MSVAVAYMPYELANIFTLPSGEESDKDSPGSVISRLMRGINEIRGPETCTFGIPLISTLRGLYEIYRQYSQQDWDGYGAAAVSLGAYEEAVKLINLLPSSIKMPEILAEPTGEIAFEWWEAAGQVFVLSVGGKHRISYAEILGEDKAHGTVYFGETFPALIYEHLRRLLL